MKRLVYAPKVWIFIRSSNILDEEGKPKIWDVSSDVVRGSITQNLGNVSTARFELRNRWHKWLRYKEPGDQYNRQIFLPMDLVTIWMQRISGYPIQVFTGYLDSVPYYQALPNTAVFEASCTLKKLAYSWFDPGLTTFSNWMQANGWSYDPGTGQILAQTRSIDGGGLATTSASFADILGRFLVDVAGWDAKDIVIGPLPVDIGKAAAELRSEIEPGITESKKLLNEFYNQLLGVNGVTGINNSPADQSDYENKPLLDAHERVISDLSPTNLKIVDQIKTIATSKGLPPWIFVFAALILTGLDPLYEKDENEASNWGYGLYAMRRVLFRYGFYASKDPAYETDKLANLLLEKEKENPHLASKARNGNVNAAIKWISNAIGYEIAVSGDLKTFKDRADQIVGTEKARPRDSHDRSDIQDPRSDAPTPVVAIDVKNTPITDQRIQSRLTQNEQKVANTTYKNHEAVMGYVVLGVKQFSSELRLAHYENLTPLQVFFTGSPERILRLYEVMKNNMFYTILRVSAGGKNKMSVNGKESSLGDPLDKEGIIITANKELLESLEVAAPNLPVGGGDRQGLEASLTLPQLAVFSANAAFAANFTLGQTDIAASNLLVGAKALMNDMSCLDAVKQIAAASLRTFRSLPDGRFMAFYPDYFGVTRKPYWRIYNIEIIDFGIQLNDEALATHVYVIGDTLFSGEAGAIRNQVASQGVATITMARMLNSFIEPLDDWDKSDTMDIKLRQANEFLQHYGARPYREDVPLIRNNEYEFLMAWQKFMFKWAQQFATTATFTFQPELMAGGIVEFPDHDVQMFCESVTHTFDYESGFQTNAILTAPSLTKGKEWSRFNKPGFALSGGINTVGVSS